MKEDKSFLDPIEDAAAAAPKRKLGRGRLFRREGDAADLKLSDLSPGFFQRKPALELQTVPAVLGTEMPDTTNEPSFTAVSEIKSAGEGETSYGGEAFRRVEDYEDDEPTPEQLAAEAAPGAPTYGYRGELIIDHDDTADSAEVAHDFAASPASPVVPAAENVPVPAPVSDEALGYEDLEVAPTAPRMNITEVPGTSRYVNQLLKDVRTQKNKPQAPVEQIEDFHPTAVYPTGEEAPVASPARPVTGLERTAPNIRAEALQALDRLASEKIEQVVEPAAESRAEAAPPLSEMPLERLYERSHEVKDLDSTAAATATPVATILSQSPLYAKAIAPDVPAQPAPVSAAPAPLPVSPAPVPARPVSGEFVPLGPNGRPLVAATDYRQAIARGFWGAMIILAVLAVWYVSRG